jgi:hypothetical protein
MNIFPEQLECHPCGEYIGGNENGIPHAPAQFSGKTLIHVYGSSKMLQGFLSCAVKKQTKTNLCRVQRGLIDISGRSVSSVTHPGARQGRLYANGGM